MSDTYTTRGAPNLAALADALADADADIAAAQTGRDAALIERDQANARAAAEANARLLAESRATAAEANAATLSQQLADARRRIQELLAGYQPPVPAGQKVAFLDTFSGDAVDTTKWTVRNDAGQNNNLGANRPANAVVKDGLLALELKREQAGTDAYTVAYLDTNAKPGNVAQGEWQCSMAMPRAKGSWPAFWLRPIGADGEIDGVEWVGDGKGGGHLVFTVHENTNGKDATGKATRKRGFEWKYPATFDPFVQHVYAVRWDGTTLSWLVDGQVVTWTNTTLTPWLATCLGGKPLAMRLCMQAGGSSSNAMPNWFGLPLDASSVLPDRALVDFVQVLVPA